MSFELLPTYQRTRSPMTFLFLSLMAMVGVASPSFAFASQHQSRYQSPLPQSSSTSPLKTRPPLPQPLLTLHSNPSHQFEPPATIKMPSRLRSVISKLSLSSGRENGRWRAGESNASIPARLLFSYVSPLLDLASNRTLTESDAFALSSQQRMDYSVEKLAHVYQKTRTKAQRKIEFQRLQQGKEKVKQSQTIILLNTLLRQNWRILVITGILRLMNTCVQAFPSILVARLLRSIEAGNSVPASKAIYAAILLVTVLSVKMVTENQFFHGVVNMATNIRGSLEGLIFDKSLRLPEGGSGVMARRDKDAEKKALGSGGVLNLMQMDATTIEFAAMQVHTTWDAPLQLALYSTLLYRYLGPSMFWGMGVLLTMIPLNAFTLRILDRLSRFENEARDARTKRTSESIINMKLLKLQGWEKQFANEVRAHRTDEMRRHKLRGLVRAVNSALSNAVPALVLAVTLTAYTKSGRPIVASTIFTAISLFNQLRFPLFFFPMLIDSMANGKNSLRRISSYLTSEEMSPYVEHFPATDGGSIEMINGNFLWSLSHKPKDGEVPPPDSPALCGVDVKVHPGEVVAVVGPVASGKTALIKGLLGELAPVPRAVVDKGMTSDSMGDDTFVDRPSVITRGGVAYCSQEAWLPKGTIRDAIVFGRDYDETKYRQAIYDAGLDQDIVTSEGSYSMAAASSGALYDDTDVGEGGSNLSGGQRARVALARALYAENAKVFLLDDCLAALDARVGSMVFERILRRVKATKAAAVFVTNDPSIPRRCDSVVLMGSMNESKCRSSTACSTIVDIGTYDELISRGHQLQSFSMSEDEGRDDEILSGREDEIDLDEHEVAATETIRVVGGYKIKTNGTDFSSSGEPDCQEVDMCTNPDYLAAMRIIPFSDDQPTDGSATGGSKTSPPSVEQPKSVGKKLSADDNMSSAAVPFSTYVGYLQAVGSPALVFAMLTAFVATNGAQFFQQYTVAKWTELAHGGAMTSALGGQYLRSLTSAAVVVSAFLWLRSYLTMLVGSRASTFFHDRMVSSVFQAPMSFFDATPSGQILSRFGKELATVDQALPESFASVLFCALQIGSSAAALAGAITPVMLIPLGFAGRLYLKTMKKFRPAARDLKRSETKTRSPIFTHFGEALRGAEIIRSIPGACATWSKAHRGLSDANLSVSSTVKVLDRWLSVSLENLGNFVVFMTAIASAMLARSGHIQPGLAGWGLTQSLAITGLMAWAVRNLTSLESHMMSVMRIRELTDLDADKDGGAQMPRELSAPGEALKLSLSDDLKSNIAVVPVNEDALKAEGWPWKGNVVFHNVSMRYSPSSPLVLRDVNLEVPAGTTVGVVGRTGSGKSSLLLTLFRIAEIESSGRIEIDGVDTRSVSIQLLRERLSIIPQDPVLFAGTIAYNLDATGKTSAEDMWAALKAASPELAAQFESSEGLDTAINEGGSNLSQGQRQLICLARALVKKSKLLVLDEATSSVDPTTDQQVQETIRREFVEKGVSVITVAHRLETVLGNDRIAVLGDGHLLEYGSPADLLKNPRGELRRLVDADRRNKRKGARKVPETLLV